jgi:hypothetical protein
LIHNNGLIDQVAEKFFDQKRQILELKRRRASRKPSVATLIKRAEKSGRTVTSATVEGEKVVLTFGESTTPTTATNPWLDDLRATKQ